MPIIEIRALPPRDPSRIPGMLREAAVSGAKAFNVPEAKVWATFEEIRAGWMAEGGASADHPGRETHPPLVLVRALSGRTLEMKKAFLAAVCDAIGRGFEIPATHVWCHYVEMEKPEVWTNQAFYG